MVPVSVMSMTHRPDFTLNRPGALIAALPAVLGFVPESSLVLVSLSDGQLGAVMRVDLSDDLADRLGHLAEVAAAAGPDAAIAVIVDAEGAHCPSCDEEYRQLCAALAEALGGAATLNCGPHTWSIASPSVAAGTAPTAAVPAGPVDDPSASPLAVAAVLDGRRLYPRRADLQAVIAVDEPGPQRRIDRAPSNNRPSGAGWRTARTRPGAAAATWRTRWPPRPASRAGKRCPTPSWPNWRAR